MLYIGVKHILYITFFYWRDKLYTLWEEGIGLKQAIQIFFGGAVTGVMHYGFEGYKNIILPLDEQILTTLHLYSNLYTTYASVCLTSFADPILISLLTFLCLLYLRLTRQELITLIVYILFALCFIGCLKWITQRTRPALFIPFYQETNSSFPSGHTFMGYIVYRALAECIAQKKIDWKRSIGLLSSLLVIGIGLSRLYLAVHWPTDVLAGFLLGKGWLFLWRPLLINDHAQHIALK